MKFRFISAHRETFKVGRMCTLLKVSRSGYYTWLKRPESRRSLENRALEDKIRVFHAASHGIYGSPKIHRDLIDDGVRCGKNRVARIMREAGIRSRTKKKFKATTNSRHNLPLAPNLLNQDFTVDAPDRTWVSDITYIHTEKGWLYLAVLLDLFNREIVGWATSSRMTRQLAIDALQMALGLRTPAQGLIHHSDRGSQYASGDYHKTPFQACHYLQYEPQRKLLRQCCCGKLFSSAQNRMGEPSPVPEQVSGNQQPILIT